MGEKQCMEKRERKKGRREKSMASYSCELPGPNVSCFVLGMVTLNVMMVNNYNSRMVQCETVKQCDC